MLHAIKSLFTIALAACAFTAYADPPARVGRLNFTAGAVSFAAAEAPDRWIGALVNRPLTSGDRLWADRDGRAEFHIGSTAVRMAGVTSLDVLNLNDDTLQFRLAQGAVNVRVRDLDPGDTVEIATPSGAVVIRRPGSYRVSVDPRTYASRVVVYFGQAEVVTPAQAFIVPSGQAAVVPLGGNIAFEVASFGSADEFDRWAAERDQRHERVASARYVSTQMTGYEDLDAHGSWRTVPEYGAVWVPTRVAPGWAPYRHGHWVWMSPWGWTWVDDAPWGFAPFHYGRWVFMNDHWAWAPGPIVRRPVYAPALVAFVGGAHWSVSIGSGPAVGWFPLGWREPYSPSYRASPAYVRNVNVTHITNVTTVYNTTNVTDIHYVNRNNPRAVTVVPQQAFVSARPIARSTLEVPRAELARAEVIRDRSPAQPVRASFAPERAGERPPAAAATREVMAVNAPPTPAARLAPEAQDRGLRTGRADDDLPRVRVIGRERAEARRAEHAGQQGARPEGANATASPAKENAAGAAASAPPQGGTDALRAAPMASPPVVARPQAPPPPAQAPLAVRETPRAAPAESAASPTVERERVRREAAVRSEPPSERVDGMRERRPEHMEREAPRPPAAVPQPPPVPREATRPAPAPQVQVQREAPIAPIPQPPVQREAPRPDPAPQVQVPRAAPTAPVPQPQVQREAPRGPAPAPQAQRDVRRPDAAQPQPQAAQQPARQPEERERPERRRGRDAS